MKRRRVIRRARRNPDYSKPEHEPALKMQREVTEKFGNKLGFLFGSIYDRNIKAHRELITDVGMSYFLSAEIADKAYAICEIIARMSFINKRMLDEKKSPYATAVSNWMWEDGLLEEDIEKIHELLVTFHDLAGKGILKGPAANINTWKSSKELFAYLKAYLKAQTGEQYYADAGCKPVAKMGEFLMFEVNDYETAKKVFKGTNWCVRFQDSFTHYGPPYFMVVRSDIDPASGEDDRVCLMHKGSLQVKNIDDEILNPAKQRAIAPLMEKVFGNGLTKLCPGDIDFGTGKIWCFGHTDLIIAFEKALDSCSFLAHTWAGWCEEASLHNTDYAYDQLHAYFKQQVDEEGGKFDTTVDDEAFDKWRDSSAGETKAGEIESEVESDWIYNIHNPDHGVINELKLTTAYDADFAMDDILRQTMGIRWSALKKIGLKFERPSEAPGIKRIIRENYNRTVVVWPKRKVNLSEDKITKALANFASVAWDIYNLGEGSGRNASKSLWEAFTYNLDFEDS